MLEQCCNHSKQCCNNVATLCCAKNRRCESSRLVSPVDPVYMGPEKFLKRLISYLCDRFTRNRPNPVTLLFTRSRKNFAGVSIGMAFFIKLKGE